METMYQNKINKHINFDIEYHSKVNLHHHQLVFRNFVFYINQRIVHHFG